MRLSLRKKFICSYLIVVFLTGTVATWVGMHLIGRGIILQAQEKVRMDLNSAREIYRENLDRISIIVYLTSIRFFLIEGLIHGQFQSVQNELGKVKQNEGLDVLTLTDEKGQVIFRTSNPNEAKDSQADDEIIAQVLLRKEPVASTQIVPREKLIKEGQQLADRAWMKMIPTAKAKSRSDSVETSGMMLKAAAPVFDNDNNLIGILYGGVLINRNYSIVDKIKDTVYKGQTYKGKDIGTATIFQKDLRISTNVTRKDGTRAIGTRVSEEVYNQVLIKGLPWIERAFVVNNWHITAYEPIRNIRNQIIGILYAGVLEEKFVDLKNNTLLIFFAITLAGILVAFTISYVLANNLIRPISHLVFASKQLAQGDLTHKVKVESKDEIGELAKTFNFMVKSLKERDKKLKKHTQERIMESERLAMVGQLAAGIAHELNNPLGGVLVYSYLLLENLNEKDPRRENLEKIVHQASRCKEIVKGLLDFSRQSEPRMDKTNINMLVNRTLSLIKNQEVFQNIEIHENLISSLPEIMIDAGQIQQVIINMLFNAAEAIQKSGLITIETGMKKDGTNIFIKVVDTGCGVPEENIKHLFEPFFSTKEAGKGIGLGLSICYGIIERHKGKIEVQTEKGKGTIFTVILPLETIQ